MTDGTVPRDMRNGGNGGVTGCAAALLAIVIATASCGGSHQTPPTASADNGNSANDEERGDLYRPPPTTNVELHNACADSVPIYFGEQPNGTTGDFVTLRGNGTSHVPRREHGGFTLWIVDDKGFGLAHVKVTHKMSKVEIGPSCRTLHAE